MFVFVENFVDSFYNFFQEFQIGMKFWFFKPTKKIHTLPKVGTQIFFVSSQIFGLIQQS